MSDNKFTATEFKRIMETHHLVTVLDVMHAKRARAKLIGDTDEQQNIEAIGEIISRFIDPSGLKPVIGASIKLLKLSFT